MTIQDGDNVNNMLIVPEKNLGHDVASARERIRSGGDLTKEERETIQDVLMALSVDRQSTSAPADLSPTTTC